MTTNPTADDATPHALAARFAREAHGHLHDARAAAGAGRPDEAYGAYQAAIGALEKALRLDDAADAAREALRMTEAFFGVDAPELDALARALDRLGDGTDYRPLLVRGRLHSLRAWALHRDGRDLATEILPSAREAERLLEAAAALHAASPDLWGTLGGVRKRLAVWCGDAIEATAWRLRALDAYRRGADIAVAPYPLINFHEVRAVLEPDRPIVRDAAERERLERAVAIRRQQREKAVERPWAAFDLARGQHYLQPDAGRFLDDLAAGVADTVRVARTPGDAWMLETTRLSLVELFNAGVDLPGLEAGIDYLTQARLGGAVDAASRAQADARDARGPLRDLTDRQDLSAAQRDRMQVLLERLDELVASDRRRWANEQEAELQRFLARAPKLWETKVQRAARVLWAVLGKQGVTAAADAVTPGGGSVAEVLVDFTAEWLKDAKD